MSENIKATIAQPAIILVFAAILIQFLFGIDGRAIVEFLLIPAVMIGIYSAAVS